MTHSSTKRSARLAVRVQLARLCLLFAAIGLLPSGSVRGQETAAGKPNTRQAGAEGLTSLTSESVRYTAAAKPFVVLERGDVRAVIAGNSAVDVPELPGHRAGYNGLASFRRKGMDRNLVVPAYAGLNFEHIHDGTLAVAREKFEPRKSSMELRVIDQFTVEVYQPPTTGWQLESCGRYHLLEDGVIEYTFECIPRAATFHQGNIGLFWASYINSPEDKAIYFIGQRADAPSGTRPGWIRAVTPRHGEHSTHPPAAEHPQIPVHEDFPLTLVNHPSNYVWTEPWYYGISQKHAFVQMFRHEDHIWFAQSPTGGGADNPAWDFQWFIAQSRPGQVARFVMRAALLPFESKEQIEQATRRHREALNPGARQGQEN